MSYVRQSTENPYGFRPWGFSLSNNGLTANPATGMSKYIGDNFAIPTHGGGLGRLGSMRKYIASPFVLPTTGTQNPAGAAPYAWPGATGLADYEVDPSTLPPAPAGMQYNAQYHLVPIPQPNYTPWLIGGAAAIAAWWYFSKSRGSGTISLPFVKG